MKSGSAKSKTGGKEKGKGGTGWLALICDADYGLLAVGADGLNNFAAPWVASSVGRLAAGVARGKQPVRLVPCATGTQCPCGFLPQVLLA